MIEIRKAEPDDALGITIVNVYTWKTSYSGLVPDEMINQRIADLLPRAQKTREGILAGGHYRVAVDGRTVIGFCLYGACREAGQETMGEIYALYVLAGYQGQGIGKSLFADAVDALGRLGFSEVCINCLRGNPALGFYLRMGGKVSGSWVDEFIGYPVAGDTILYQISEPR